MAETAANPPLFRGICDWLIDRALRERDLAETVLLLGNKLVEGGLPICRINVGALLLHPVMGALDITWEPSYDTCRSQLVPRSIINSADFRNAPFFKMVSEKIPFERHRLDDPAQRKRFPILEKLSDSGVTDYVALFETYGRTVPMDWADAPAGSEGTCASFSTKRITGFTDREVAHLRELSATFSLVVKVAIDQMLAKALLETYLGRISGANVLAGLVEKGDGRLIKCALWYSDLRGSTAMAEELKLDAYFSTIGEYFDCTAGAVLDHGGEVLKYIGDAVMAIFPFEDATRPSSDMCRAALMSAREALSRAEITNTARADRGLAPFAFGIGLHVGKVMYGNVGTERRLDLTVTGPAANEVARLESLTKRLAVPVVASRKFNALCPADLSPLGRHDVAGIDGGMDTFTLPDLRAGHLETVEGRNR